MTLFLVCFIVAGSILIYNLRSFFKRQYTKQRKTLMAALLLTILSLLVLGVRYSLEYVYSLEQISIGADTAAGVSLTVG